MQVGGIYSHKQGEEFIRARHGKELAEVIAAIEQIEAPACLRKQSKEKTKPPLLFSPEDLNVACKANFCRLGWTKEAPHSRKGYVEPRISLGGGEFREMDGIKNMVGLEVQFGKYVFMGYDIVSKMPIFANRGLIECGIEVVVMASMIRNMSTGVSSFTEIVMDMHERGVADLDVPTLVIGIECTPDEITRCEEKRMRFRTNAAEMIAAGEVSTGRKGTGPGPK